MLHTAAAQFCKTQIVIKWTSEIRLVKVNALCNRSLRVCTRTCFVNYLLACYSVILNNIRYYYNYCFRGGRRTKRRRLKQRDYWTSGVVHRKRRGIGVTRWMRKNLAAAVHACRFAGHWFPVCGPRCVRTGGNDETGPPEDRRTYLRFPSNLLTVDGGCRRPKFPSEQRVCSCVRALTVCVCQNVRARTHTHRKRTPRACVLVCFSTRKTFTGPKVFFPVFHFKTRFPLSLSLFLPLSELNARSRSEIISHDCRRTKTIQTTIMLLLLHYSYDLPCTVYDTRISRVHRQRPLYYNVLRTQRIL